MSTPHNININDGDVNVDDSIVDQMDFIENLANIVPAKDVEMVKQFQKNMLNRFEKTNEMLVNCNALSQVYYDRLSKDYRQNTQKLTEMYKDLDSIFHRIRVIKQKLKTKYPNAVIDDATKSFDENDEDMEGHKENPPES